MGRSQAFASLAGGAPRASVVPPAGVALNQLPQVVIDAVFATTPAAVPVSSVAPSSSPAGDAEVVVPPPAPTAAAHPGESQAVVIQLVNAQVLTNGPFPEHPNPLPSARLPLPLVPAPFVIPGPPERERPPVAPTAVWPEPLSPLPPKPTAPAEKLPLVPDVVSVIPAQACGLLAPLLPVAAQELDQVVQDLMSHLDNVRPPWNRPRSGTDWLPWVVVLAGAGAAYELGRRTCKTRSSEDGPAFGPVRVP